MAKVKEQPPVIALGVVGVLVAAYLFSPLYVGVLASPEQKLARQVEPAVDEVIVMLDRLDESLTQVSEIRQRLVAAGADLSSAGMSKYAEAHPDSLEKVAQELGPKGSLPVDQILSAAEREHGLKSATPAYSGLGGRGASVAQRSYTELSKLIKDNSELIQNAKSKISAARQVREGEMSGGDSLSVNRAAALVSLAEGRVLRDKAWLDRWQAQSLRGLARDQALKAAEMRRTADGAGARTPSQAIEKATARQAELEKKLAALREETEKQKQMVGGRKAQIEKLTKDAQTARAAMAEMDLKPFKPSDPMKSGEQFKSYQEKYEQLSAAARAAESQAESLRSGALVGGELAATADGDLLNGAYEGAKAGEGLVAAEAHLADLEMQAKSVAADVAMTKSDLEKLNATAQMLDGEKTALNTAADEQAAAARKTMGKISELMASARKLEESAVATFDSGGQAAQKAQTAAQKRKQDADHIKNEANAEKTAERLNHIINDKDTEAATLTLAADLAWAAADTYWQAIQGVEVDQKFQEAQAALMGGEAPSSGASPIDGWRKEANKRLSTAVQKLGAAKTLIATATFEGADNVRIVGANYKWQVSQLEAGVHWLMAILADSEEGAKDAVARARADLNEALTGRESSPNLAAAAEALKALPQ